MSRRALQLALALGAAGLFGLLAVGYAQSQTPPPDPDDGGVIPHIPALTNDERTQATELAMNAVDALGLAKQASAEVDVGVWHTSRDLRKIGAGVMIKLSAPVALAAKWPSIDYDRSELSAVPYTKSETTYAVANASALVVLVDLGLGNVVSLQPYGTEMEIVRGDPDARRRTTPIGD